MQTEQVKADKAGLARAGAVLQAGGLAAFSTETVYGLGADARNPDAVAAIYAAKGRPSFNPLIVHVATVGAAQELVVWSETADLLAHSFWPGPLTLVLPLAAGHGLAPAVTAGLDTVALRVPAHPAAQALLHGFGGPAAAPSANISGSVSPTTAAHVLDGLSGRIDLVLDAGPCAVGLESTILAVRDGNVTLLREGGLAREHIEYLLGDALSEVAPNAGITAPGQLSSHYAPRAALRLNARAAEPGEVLLGFGDMACDLNLSPDAVLEEAAARLFSALRALDSRNQPIAVAEIPEEGLGRAINDRLRRAAAPRP